MAGSGWLGLALAGWPWLALAGSGHADKGEVQDAVMRELQLSERPKPDDAADALAVGLTAWFQR